MVYALKKHETVCVITVDDWGDGYRYRLEGYCFTHRHNWPFKKVEGAIQSAKKFSKRFGLTLISVHICNKRGRVIDVRLY